ncbi:N-acetyltransferase [Arachnia propionica]|uniref:N-acetyltransferase n=1 Tax=Arachnia propionica TaxID=1750 RepID=A0A3P1T8D3_9ACTN|nr:GNAT family N-acetyltransferase [Arachnia propionica]RRD05704.1 N-acetyltransferase [Arachnia propionica]
MTVSIEEILTPQQADETSWVAFHRLRQLAFDEELGQGVRQVTPENALKAERSDTMFATRRWLAWLDSQPVGTAVLDVNTVDDPTGGFVTIFVVPGLRRRGIGRQLAERVRTGLGQETTRLVSEISTPPPSGDEMILTSPSGAGAVPKDHPGVQMALSFGFRLGQVGRIGHYEFEDPAVPLDQALSEARAAARGYEVLCLEGVPAPELRDDLAVLKARMSVDEPVGELPRVLTQWDAARVVEFYSGQAEVCRVFIALAVEKATGRAVAINELLSSRSLPANPLYQWDTLVLPEHRGHRLGMLVKAANLQAVHAAVPEARLVTTFNAAENQPMLAVNEALGFRTHHLAGSFSITREQS